ncbi:unnamed protein product [Rotaria socialis]
MSSHKVSYEKWHDGITRLGLKHRPTCILFSKEQPLPPEQHQNEKCGCGRLKRSHSYVGQPKSQNVDKWNYQSCSKQIEDMKNFGILYNQYESRLTKLIRCNTGEKPENLYKLIQNDCNEKSRLIISIYGGAKYFEMNERLEKEFMRGIIEAATIADGWILTTGLSSGIGKLVGEAILQDRMLNGGSKDLVSIGLAKWGSLPEETRELLSKKFTNQKNGINADTNDKDYEFPREILKTTDAETIEMHHTYMLLFDDGQLSGYIGDGQRRSFVQEATNDENKCSAVTVIVEGGINTLEVILNNLEDSRPVVIIDGSGRIADVLSDLLKQNPECVPEEVQIDDGLNKFFQNDETNSDPSRKSFAHKCCKREIKKIMNMKYRDLLNVYSLDKDSNVAKTIFDAIFKSYKMMVPEHQDNCHDQPENQDHSRKIIETLLDLSIKWNSLEGLKQVLKHIKRKAIKLSPEELGKHFITSLEDNKSMLVDYLLRSQYDVLEKLQKQDVLKLYKNSWTKQHAKTYLFPALSGENREEPTSLAVVDAICEEYIGSFMQPLHCSKKQKLNQILTGLKRTCCELTQKICRCCWKPKYNINYIHNYLLIAMLHPGIQASYSEQHKLRDLFLWSVFMGHVELAKVLLVHLKPRICASLIASKVFTEYSKHTNIFQFKDKMKNIADEFELYAVKCIDSCYEYNETKACELILRQISLFGNITIAQVAVSAKSKKFLLTACFGRVMSEAWYDKLDEINRSAVGTPMITLGLLSFGVLAPLYVVYRNQNQEEPQEQITSNRDDQVDPNGINHYMSSNYSQKLTFRSYLNRFISFHECPMIKMMYNFIANVWLLLTFSYMMLYHFDPPLNKKRPHWTEIFVIITITTILLENIRQKYSTFVTNMRECENTIESKLLLLLTNFFHIALYALFYTGTIMRHTMGNIPHLLAVARILMAIDLELWYLRSLKFMISHSYLGPKLLMIKAMTRDLAAFLYVIFVFITAYGVVSRSMIMHNQVEFSIHGIFSGIFYTPYSFLFGGSDKVLEGK